MSKKSNEDPTKIESVRGPPGAPIGYGVHKLAAEGGAPYAEKQSQRVMEAPANGVQHQPVILPLEKYEAPKEAPELTYRQEVGSKGVRASDATLDKLVAKGMTPEPKVRFDNSIIADKKNNSAYDTFLAPELDPKAAKDANAKISADPNAGAPKDP